MNQGEKVHSKKGSTMKPLLIISCGIFKAELEYLMREHAIDSNVLFLDAALHVNFDRLKEKLVQALEDSKKRGNEIRVFYGNCHPEMMKIMEHYGAKKIDAINCIEAIVGREELRKLNAEGKSFFLTAGWTNNWENIFAAGRADFNFDFSSMFTDYKRAIVFDAGVIPIDESKIKEFCRFTGLPVERRQISLGHLLRFLTVKN